MASRFQRNNTDMEDNQTSTINRQVSKFMRNKKNDVEVMKELRNKFQDRNLRDAIFEEYKNRYEKIEKKANKFKNILSDRYKNLSFDELVTKAKKYAKKYELSDDEFNMFFHLTLKENMQKSQNIPSTKLSKTLGYPITMTDKLNVKNEELNVLNDILKLHGETSTLHSQVVLQTLQYEDCSKEALAGEVDDKTRATSKNNFFSYVHPVVAALFLPKIKLLEEQMLISNIGSIVKTKKEGQQIRTKPDFNLYISMVHDPNELACATESAITDLKNRFILQTHLWDSVLNLRQGKYYHEKLADFLLAVENCKNNIYDSPDLTYVKDEGTILRRIMSAFSLRPTYVNTSRIMAHQSDNQLAPQSMFSYGSTGSSNSLFSLNELTTIPMINLRLPININNQGVSISLEQALEQSQWYIENKMIVPKRQQLIGSNDVLFFYVGRRYKSLNISRMSTPYNFSNLPMTVAGFESLNDKVVNFKENMTIINDTYKLRSVVFVDTSPKNNNLIIGCSTGVIIPADIENNIYQDEYILYDPLKSAYYNISGEKNNPITAIPGSSADAVDGVESFYSRASKRGTIFMYQKV